MQVAPSTRLADGLRRRALHGPELRAASVFRVQPVRRRWSRLVTGMTARSTRLFHATLGRRWGSSSQYSATIDATNRAEIEKSDVGRIFLAHTGRLVHKWTQYFPAYSSQFEQYRVGFPQPDGGLRPLRFLEIGVSHGGSLQLWREYFGPDAVIYGIDVNPSCAQFDDAIAKVRIGSQADAGFLRSVVEEMGGVDIVLDDGSHVANHQRASLDVLLPLVSDGGIYAVEDLHTSYWANFGGGLRRRGAFIEILKAVVDDMHDSYHGKSRRVLPTGVGLDCVAVFDSLVFLHKQAPTRPTSVRIGTDSI